MCLWEILTSDGLMSGDTRPPAGSHGVPPPSPSSARYSASYLSLSGRCSAKYSALLAVRRRAGLREFTEGLPRQSLFNDGEVNVQASDNFKRHRLYLVDRLKEITNHVYSTTVIRTLLLFEYRLRQLFRGGV